MSELKATPAPWAWNEDRFRGGWSGLFGANDRPVIYPQRENDGDEGAAWFATEDDAGDEGLSEADRNLIASAPRLYQALENTARELNAVIEKMNAELEAKITATDLDPPDYWDQQTVQEAMEVLAMARGEMP